MVVKRKPGKRIALTCIFSLFLFFAERCTAQDTSRVNRGSTDTSLQKSKLYYKTQRDLIDYFNLLLHKNPDKRIGLEGNKGEKLFFSGAPSLEYSLTTGLAATIEGDMAFYTHEDGETNISSILMGVGYTQKSQLFIPVRSSIWTKNNGYDILGDYRFEKYPQDTYGFGGHSSLSDGYIVDYSHVRFYETVLKTIATNLYIGLGIQFDTHWGIKEELTANTHLPTDFEKYGFSNKSVSSGIGADFLFDNRKNAINPEGGSLYSNVVFRQNSTILGSNTNWNSLLIDVRKYIQLSPKKILAFWSYNYFTLSGNPPYLDLPGTASDTYSNSGRGYIQRRFIGKKMMDVEGELRFGITKNGFLGGVIFANAESLSELQNNRFEVISPGCGTGLRIMFNKFSRTNICIDYGIGVHGSHGIFANLGEVF